jgi:hypothetical protein
VTKNPMPIVWMTAIWTTAKKTALFLASLVLLFCLAVSVDDYEYSRS